MTDEPIVLFVASTNRFDEGLNLRKVECVLQKNTLRLEKSFGSLNYVKTIHTSKLPYHGACSPVFSGAAAREAEEARTVLVGMLTRAVEQAESDLARLKAQLGYAVNSTPFKPSAGSREVVLGNRLVGPGDA